MNIGGFVRSMRALAEVPSRSSAPFAEYATKKLQDQWVKEQDAYGQVWAPYAESSVARGRGPNLLDESGAMRSGTRAVPMSGAGVRLEVGHGSVASFHQRGTIHMPRRRVLPDAGLPTEWRAELKRIAIEEAREAIG